MATKKKWIAFNFDPQLLQQIEINKSTVINGKEKPKKQTKPLLKKEESPDIKLPIPTKNFKFFNKIAPQTTEDLAVHPKKIEVVEGWINENILNDSNKMEASLLLITGPSGCGKLSTVKVLCKQKSIAVNEWSNPTKSHFQPMEYTDSNYGNFQSQASKFLEYIVDSNYSSLGCEPGRTITIVKDFPNIFLRTPEEFNSVLEEISGSNVKVIFIATDAANASIDIERKLFPDSTRIKYNIGTITFNTCAVTLMKAAIKRAQKLIQPHMDMFRMPSEDVFEAICAASNGDLSCLMNQFYLAALKGAGAMPTELKKSTELAKPGAKRKRTTKSVILKSKLKDQMLGLFHSIGRVLNPKIDPETNRILHDLNLLVDEFSSQPNVYLSFMFENYIKHYGDIDDAMNAAELLSTSLKFMEKWSEQHETLVIGLWISTMGLMLTNKHKISKWNPITGPVKIQKVDKTKLAITDPSHIHIGHQFMSTTDCCYYNMIKKCDKFHSFKIQSF